MNRHGQGRGRRGNGNGRGRGSYRQDEASSGQGRREGGVGRGRGMGWQADPENGVRYSRPVSDFVAGKQPEEKKSWLKNFKAHLLRRIGEVDEELGKL